MIRVAQLTDGLIHTTQNESNTCASNASAKRAGSAAVGDSIRAKSSELSVGRFSQCRNFGGNNFGGNNFGGNLDGRRGRRGHGAVLYTFMYRPYSLLKLGQDCLDSAQQLVNRLAQQVEWPCSIRQTSIRQSLEPRTIHRSRERRQSAMFSV